MRLPPGRPLLAARRRPPPRAAAGPRCLSRAAGAPPRPWRSTGGCSRRTSSPCSRRSSSTTRCTCPTCWSCGCATTGATCSPAPGSGSARRCGSAPAGPAAGPRRRCSAPRSATLEADAGPRGRHLLVRCYDASWQLAQTRRTTSYADVTDCEAVRLVARAAQVPLGAVDADAGGARAPRAGGPDGLGVPAAAGAGLRPGVPGVSGASCTSGCRSAGEQRPAPRRPPAPSRAGSSSSWARTCWRSGRGCRRRARCATSRSAAGTRRPSGPSSPAPRPAARGPPGTIPARWPRSAAARSTSPSGRARRPRPRRRPRRRRSPSSWAARRWRPPARRSATPQLTAGAAVHVTGAGAPFDGRYVLTRDPARLRRPRLPHLVRGQRPARPLPAGLVAGRPDRRPPAQRGGRGRRGHRRARPAGARPGPGPAAVAVRHVRDVVGARGAAGAGDAPRWRLAARGGRRGARRLRAGRRPAAGRASAACTTASTRCRSAAAWSTRRAAASSGGGSCPAAGTGWCCDDGRDAPGVVVESGDGSVRIALLQQETVVEVTSDGEVRISGARGVSLSSDADISVHAKGRLELRGDAGVSVQGGPEVAVSAAAVRLGWRPGGGAVSAAEAGSPFVGAGLASRCAPAAPGRIALVTGHDELQESMRLVLGTARGERPRRPEFGCGVHDLVFDAVDAALIRRVEDEVRAALLRWEPRVDVLAVEVGPDPGRPAVLLIDVAVRRARHQRRPQPRRPLLRAARRAGVIPRPAARRPAVPGPRRRRQARRQRRCPEWTDHNVSDPGVTLIELFADMTDQLLYRLNRVPDKHHLAFLDLLGVRLFPPDRGRRTGDLLAVRAAPGPRTSCPAGTQVATSRDAGGEPVGFTTTVRPARSCRAGCEPCGPATRRARAAATSPRAARARGTCAVFSEAAGARRGAAGRARPGRARLRRRAARRLPGRRHRRGPDPPAAALGGLGRQRLGCRARSSATRPAGSTGRATSCCTSPTSTPWRRARRACWPAGCAPWCCSSPEAAQPGLHPHPDAARRSRR